MRSKAHDSAALMILAVGVILSGCSASIEPALTPSPQPLSSRAVSHTHPLGVSVHNTPIEAVSLGRGAESVVVIAGIHGNEPAGVPLADRLVEVLSAEPERLTGKTVWILSRANPDGLEAGTRRNVNDVDINRNFPSDNFKPTSRNGAAPLSQPESRALRRLIDLAQPNRVVSIHQPIACVDYDGPAEALASAMADAMNLPVKKLGSRPGSLGSYVGLERGIPIITLELPGRVEGLGAEKLWQRYGEGLLGFIAGE